jgi:hypothetical protein
MFCYLFRACGLLIVCEDKQQEDCYHRLQSHEQEAFDKLDLDQDGFIGVSDLFISYMEIEQVMYSATYLQTLINLVEKENPHLGISRKSFQAAQKNPNFRKEPTRLSCSFTDCFREFLFRVRSSAAHTCNWLSLHMLLAYVQFERCVNNIF